MTFSKNIKPFIKKKYKKTKINNFFFLKNVINIRPLSLREIDNTIINASD
jgi:hypothetical protein